MITLQTLTVELSDKVALLRFNRGDKANSLNQQMWQDLREALDWADGEAGVRAVVLAGHGKHFCAGIDLSMLMSLQSLIQDECEGRKRDKLRRVILDLQDCVTSLERCRKPVIAAIHGACLGGGLDIALAADFRFAAEDAVFGVREVDIGMVADVGSLQRLPRVVGEGVARELALTGRDMVAQEALDVGLVNKVLADAEAVLAAAMQSARLIAGKSPLAVRGSKEVLNYSRDRSVADGLQFVAGWNAAMLISEDIQKAGMAAMMKQEVSFRD
ncbi:crotonase/enoyl-CoA hydratase family protein [Chromobacterium sp. IIBBL 290-4]|uniref:crotonase/enoyl-CoA hydratase family protein n=1 Tax=Chromobacterium sp. IIBBL 290-4 TaxID=2953890 RepID=UPI0020B8B5D0|nr:crotonase/enoyl-CoA hydratase family protein [Chromobacterium sp. IIBBL 290-4]UTH73683.1 crotonase/enoyl-CoA hydratase family protein [Chromobacterium sp. IIBBL 290-4]